MQANKFPPPEEKEFSVDILELLWPIDIKSIASLLNLNNVLCINFISTLTDLLV